MPRPFFLVLTRRWIWAGVVFLAGLVVLAIYGSFPLAVFTLNALPSEILYDVMLDPGHGGIDPGGSEGTRFTRSTLPSIFPCACRVFWKMPA